MRRAGTVALVLAAVGLGLQLASGGDIDAAGGSKALPNATQMRRASVPKIYVGRIGDTFRVPGVGLICLVSQEGKSPNVVCERNLPNKRPRYEVVFYRGITQVYRLGDPDHAIGYAESR